MVLILTACGQAPWQHPQVLARAMEPEADVFFSHSREWLLSPPPPHTHTLRNVVSVKTPLIVPTEKHCVWEGRGLLDSPACAPSQMYKSFEGDWLPGTGVSQPGIDS